MNDDFLNIVAIEIEREKRLIEKNTQLLAGSPKGFLDVRKRRTQSSYYWTFYEGHGANRRQKQININKDTNMIVQLTDKMISSFIVENGISNLPLLEQLATQFKDMSQESILQQCAPKYQEACKLRVKKQLEKSMIASYNKCLYNPKYHKHVTDYGERVRSKSEQLLANSLYAYGIPFHYEEEFLSKVGRFGRIYPDFTIFLPRNRYIIWEHLGLLSNEEYCISNARKLNIYQLNGFTLGENLILTMDDNKGNFSSSIINKIIKEQILPKMEGITIDKDLIIQSAALPYMNT